VVVVIYLDNFWNTIGREDEWLHLSGCNIVFIVKAFENIELSLLGWY
jgi:hypothetical protein